MKLERKGFVLDLEGTLGMKGGRANEGDRLLHKWKQTVCCLR